MAKLPSTNCSTDLEEHDLTDPGDGRNKKIKVEKANNEGQIKLGLKSTLSMVNKQGDYHHLRKR